MKKHIVVYSCLIVFFLIGSYYTKSEYFNHPYPNIEEYSLSIVLLMYTAVSMIWEQNRWLKAILGVSATVLFILALSILNYLNEWHPLGLKAPFSSSQTFKVNYEPFEWPKEMPEKHGFPSKVLDDYYAKLESWKRLRGLAVISDDKLIIEKYFKGADKYDAFNVHSVTKSITSALIGIAIDKGNIQGVEDQVMAFFPEYQNNTDSLKNMLSIEHLLTMKGGFAHWDDYLTPKECLVDVKINKTPGSNFKYFTGSQAILSAILTKTSQYSTKEFAQKHLFEPIGINNGFWRLQEGYYCGGGESYYTVRDLARLGQLYLKRGKLDSQEIISEAWIEKSFTNHVGVSEKFRTLGDYKEAGYGYCWWILDYQGHKIYTARGKGGQYLMVIPEIDVVVVIIQEWNLRKEFEVENKLMCDLLSILFKHKEPENN